MVNEFSGDVSLAVPMIEKQGRNAELLAHPRSRSIEFKIRLGL